MSASSDGPSRAGRRFATFLAAVCLHVRESTHASEERIADLAGVKGISIERFEKGETFPNANFDQYLAAYAYDANIDPRDLISMAIDWWREHGEPPRISREVPVVERELKLTPAGIVAMIRDAEQQEQRRAAERPISIRKSRASRTQSGR